MDILEERNSRIFEGSPQRLVSSFKKLKLRLCNWLLSNKEFKGLKACDLLRSWEGFMGGLQRRYKKLVDWSPPQSGEMKFNVDGASRGKPGPAGIGGVPRDDQGTTSLVFFELVRKGIRMRLNCLVLGER